MTQFILISKDCSAFSMTGQNVKTAEKFKKDNQSTKLQTPSAARESLQKHIDIVHTKWQLKANVSKMEVASVVSS